MSDVINSIFGRPKNENTGSAGYAYGTVEPAPVVAEAPAESAPGTDEAAVVEETESAPEAEAAAETVEDQSEAGTDDAAEASDEEVTGADEEAVAEDTEEDSAEADVDSAEEDSAEDDVADDDVAEDVAETDAEPEAEAVAAEEPVAEAEPAAETASVTETEPAEAETVAAEPVAEAEPAAARPAAGSRGSTTIADGVVGKIVVRIAAQTAGVHSVAEDGITVELADEVAWVTIPVVIEFGHAVKALGEQIRVAVIDAVEQFLGLDVEVVDVYVTDIHFPEAD
ncbi:Asp23/Gls24 family envelope stress response protein [Amycolatopsis sp. NPDC004169]|uniref:Asp23/Gls24 family envelope stress response protein n=1 Tax=Amycolatopsis sp. NPDC004169 TaxID=3154453 RepID=UPI0033A8F49C